MCRRSLFRAFLLRNIVAMKDDWFLMSIEMYMLRLAVCLIAVLKIESLYKMFDTNNSSTNVSVNFKKWGKRTFI